MLSRMESALKASQQTRVHEGSQMSSKPSPNGDRPRRGRGGRTVLGSGLGAGILRDARSGCQGRSAPSAPSLSPLDANHSSRTRSVPRPRGSKTAPSCLDGPDPTGSPTCLPGAESALARRLVRAPMDHLQGMRHALRGLDFREPTSGLRRSFGARPASGPELQP